MASTKSRKGNDNEIFSQMIDCSHFDDLEEED